MYSLGFLEVFHQRGILWHFPDVLPVFLCTNYTNTDITHVSLSTVNQVLKAYRARGKNSSTNVVILAEINT